MGLERDGTSKQVDAERRVALLDGHEAEQEQCIGVRRVDLEYLTIQPGRIIEQALLMKVNGGA
jgi:hypothetical protein